MGVNHDEILLEVDERNQPIGELSRREMQAGTSKWVRTGDVVVINSQKQIVCHQRHPDLRSWPGLWAYCFGGHAEPGEDPIATALKELREESGIEVASSKLRSLGVYRDQTRHKFKHYFLLGWDGDINDLELEADEVVQAKWMELSEVEKIYAGNDPDWASVGNEVFQLQQIKKLIDLIWN